MAQGFSGTATSPMATFPGMAGAAPQPGQPIITNPTALQPISPALVPCPTTTPSSLGPQGLAQGVQAPSQGPATSFQGMSAFQGLQSTLSPQSSGNAGTPAVNQGGGGGPSSSQTSGMGTTGSSGSASLLRGSVSPSIQQQIDPFSTTPQPGVSRGQAEDVGQLSIEENFARFFILQGVTGQLRQFGYNFFDVQFSGIPSVMDLPVGPDYVLGPQDTLALHIWNVPDSNLNRSYIMPVERDGTVFIPHVGAIPVAGLNFAQATRLIQARLSTLLKRFEMHLSMARLRTIKVFVVGEVIRPGAYEVSSLATASHALYSACGPSKSGSLRHMQVIRDGKSIGDLDFYRFFLLGDRTQDVRLQAGDTLLVPPIGPVAAIGGPVRRPAIYEIKERTTILDLIEMAGGLAPTADRERCQIFRIEAGLQRVIVDVPLGAILKAKNDSKGNGYSSRLASGAAPMVQDGDFVRISAVPTQIENAVTLIGAVRSPGFYEFRPGMKLKDLLTQEQLLTESFMDRAEVVRTDPVTYDTSVIAFSPRNLMKGDEENMELRRLDKVVVLTQIRPPRTVAISGEVKRQGVFTIESGERLSSVLKRAGGLTMRAFPQGIVLIRETVRKSQQAELDKFVSAQKQKLINEAASLAAGSVGVSSAGTSTAQQEQATLHIQMQGLDNLVSRVQLGRVVVRMDSLEQLEGSPEDIMLEHLDQIAIPQQPQTVNIMGAVRTPTSVVYHADLNVEDYVRLAGGMTDEALEKELYVVRANGSADAAYVKLKDMRPGDTIVVPERVEPKMRPLPLWQAVASIIGSAALGIAAISVVGR
jgi:protein involved in polysaccharide export with SLBB domain